MRKKLVRFVSALALLLLLLLVCYGLTRSYLAYEASRAARMLNELAAVKIGDSEGQVLAVLHRYGNCHGGLEVLTKFDKADFECLVEIGPSGIYHLVDRANTGGFYHLTRSVLSSLNPRLR